MSADEITQIRVGRQRMGIIGLQAMLEDAARELTGKPDAEIGAELLRRLSKRNYIPESAAADYRQAFLREYKKFVGQPVAETKSATLEIKVLGAGCSRCDQLEQDLMAVMAETGLVGDIEHVTDIKAIGQYGAMGTPALVVNGKVVAVGLVPPKVKLKKWLTEASTQQSD